MPQITHQYRLTSETGPAHKKQFTVTLLLGTEEYTAEGASIKKAQHAAAADALVKTCFEHPPPKTQRVLKVIDFVFFFLKFYTAFPNFYNEKQCNLKLYFLVHLKIIDSGAQGQRYPHSGAERFGDEARRTDFVHAAGTATRCVPPCVPPASALSAISLQQTARVPDGAATRLLRHS